MARTTRCQYCPAQVLFVPAAKTGKSLILNATPDPAGNTIIGEDGKAYVVGSKTMFDEVPSGDRYMSHWATYPGREQARQDADARKGK